MNYMPNKGHFITFCSNLRLFLTVCSIIYPLSGHATETNTETPVLGESIGEGCSTPPREVKVDENMFKTPEGPEHKINHTEEQKRALAASYVEIMGFQQGDLLYGLEDSRRFIRDMLQNRYGAVTIDAYNNIYLSINKDKTKGWNDLDKEIESHVVGEGSNLLEENHYWARNFAKFLFNDGIFDRIVDEVAAENRKFKKISCKYALIFSKLSGFKIHFVLDQLDLFPVVYKGGDEFTNEEFLKAYTASELRYLYRMWMNDNDSIDHVYFYRAGKRLESPPWVTHSTFWRNYKSKPDRKSEEKQRLSESCDPEWQQNIPVMDRKRKHLDFSGCS